MTLVLGLRGLLVCSDNASISYALGDPLVWGILEGQEEVRSASCPKTVSLHQSSAASPELCLQRSAPPKSSKQAEQPLGPSTPPTPKELCRPPAVLGAGALSHGGGLQEAQAPGGGGVPEVRHIMRPGPWLSPARALATKA